MKKKQKRIFVAAVLTALGIVSLLSLKGQAAEGVAPMHSMDFVRLATSR